MTKSNKARGQSGRTPGATEAIDVRLSEVGRATLRVLADHWGLTPSGLLEMVLRQTAREEGLRISVRDGCIDVTDADGHEQTLSMTGSN